jgi:ubiquinone/menaquinone biosynthesis C-methylase UbiE
MPWEKYFNDWEYDEKQPMTHPDVDISYSRYRFEFGRRLVKHFKIDLKGKKVLDVAIGSGGILCAFAEAGAICYGLDVNDYFLNMSKQRFKDLGLKYVEIRKWGGGGYKIPYPNEYFDFVICTDTLEHAPKWKFFTREICRVLKKGGHTFVTAERRWFPYFVLKNPHDNMPFTILLPKRARAWIERNILKLPPLDYHLFSWTWEIKNEFGKHGVKMKSFDNIKRQRFEETNYPKFLWKFYNLMFIHCLGIKESE